MPSWFRHFIGILLLSLASVGLTAAAQEMRLLRIATGPTGGTYFPVGALIAGVLSSPPGARECDPGGRCGVPGLIVSAQSTQGSVENVEALRAGRFQTALMQTDVAYRAWSGKGLSRNAKPFPGLRVLARLYPEQVHLVTREGSGIKSVRDLRGKRVGLGEKASGTLATTRLILEAYGVPERRIEAVYQPLTTTTDLMRREEIDAFFMVGGAPINAIAELAKDVPIDLVPITGPSAERVAQAHPYLSAGQIPEDAYVGVEAVPTLALGALWVATDDLDADLVYEMLRAFWNPANQKLLENGHPVGKRILLSSALDGVAVPLHPGAERFYREAGLLTN